MLMLKSKELREQRAKLIAESRAALTGEVTPEVRQKVTKIDADIEALEADITLYEKQEKREREIAAQQGTSLNTEDGGNVTEETRKAAVQKEVRAYEDAFFAYLAGRDMSPEQRATLKKGFVAEKEGRAQTITTSAGGYTIPQGFQAELERAQKYFAGVLSIARILNTNGGNPLPWPTVDDTANSGEDKAINVGATAQDVVFGQAQLNAYKIGSGLILVPTELFEDTGLDLQAELVSIMGERLGRRRNNKYTVGSGTNDFSGCVTGASLGLTFAGVAAITTDELITLQHKVDKAYRNNPKCAFQMNDDTVRYVRQLKDGQGRYILDPALLADGLDTLLGKPLVTNNDMATLATGNKTVLFGDHSKFIIRNVRNVVVRRMDEKYADADQVGFVAWYRGDSKLVSASSAAFVYAKQA